MPESHFVGPIDRLLYLRTLPQLTGLDGDELAVIARQAEEIHLRAGEHVLRAGETIRHFFVIVEGRVRLRHDDRDMVTYDAGNTVGMIPALARAAPTFEALADTDCVLLGFELDAILATMEENFRLLQNAIRSIAAVHVQVMPHVIGGTQRAPWTGEAVAVPDRPLDVVERLVLLRRGNIFRDLGLEAMMLMATSMVQQRWPAGTPLWKPGDPADHLLVLLDGEVDCELPDGTRFEAGRGYPLGNLETLALARRWYTPVTRTPLSTLRGDHETLFDVLEDDFDVAVEFLSAVARGALGALHRLAELRQTRLVPAPWAAIR